MDALFFFSSRRRHTRLQGDWSSDVCSSDLESGEVTTCTTGPGGVGLVRRRGFSHAASSAAGRATAVFESARRFDSLNVNGMGPTPPNEKEPPASTHSRLRWRPGGRREQWLALVP